MSVSFGPAMDQNVEHIITCICGETNFDIVYATRIEAYNAKVSGAFKATCGDVYCEYLYVQPFINEPEVNMSNSNSVLLLDVLGIQVGEAFEERCGGELDAKDFLGRVLIAEGVSPVDAGRPETITKSGITMIDCGRPEGYINEKLDALREVAEWSIANNRSVVWG